MHCLVGCQSSSAGATPVVLAVVGTVGTAGMYSSVVYGEKPSYEWDRGVQAGELAAMGNDRCWVQRRLCLPGVDSVLPA